MATKENEAAFRAELEKKFKAEWEKRLSHPDGDKKSSVEDQVKTNEDKMD